MSHVTECTSIILSLKNIFPPELIQIIIRLYWNLHSEPVLLLYSSIAGPIRNLLIRNFSLMGGNILAKILETKSNLRFCHMEARLGGKYSLVESNFKCTSTLLSIMRNMINTVGYVELYLIPGTLWNYAALYPDSEVENINGIQICGQLVNDNRSWYELKAPDKILNWVKDTLNDPDFLAVQNAWL